MDLIGLADKLEARTEELKAEFGDPDGAVGQSNIKAEASAGAHL